MREALFRAKEKDDGAWVYGWYCRYPFGKWPLKDVIIPSEEAKNGYHRFVEVDHSTVGQYTGLLDKDGKRIFEGDVVECLKDINGNWIDKHIEIGYVEMRHGAFGLHRKQGYYRPFKDWLEDYEYEVVGNIHDNPEMMGEVSDNG